MKNDSNLINLLLIVLLFALMLGQIKINNRLDQVNETITQYFEAPLPDYNPEEFQEDGRY